MKIYMRRLVGGQRGIVTCATRLRTPNEITHVNLFNEAVGKAASLSRRVVTLSLYSINVVVSVSKSALMVSWPQVEELAPSLLYCYGT